LRTRFAPSPSGYLHLGHVLHAIYVWGLAQCWDATVLLRLEDHDRQRCKPEYAAALLEDLHWLGFLPEPLAPSQVWQQQDRLMGYAAALEALATSGHAYACHCSRAAIVQRTGQQGGDELRYDGHCRHLGLPIGPDVGIRVALPDEQVAFEDIYAGPQRQHPATQVGDVLARDRHGNFTYQWAVVLDDLAQDINLVIRGADILASTGRQLLLRRLLGSTQAPLWVHHPLITAGDGQKLSKRDGATGIRTLRAQGYSAQQVLGLAAQMGGLQHTAQPLAVPDLPQFLCP
jgi:glutamyl-tRNA synthetase/glutamyl-Q tRNA(Asp) synthetase